MGRGDPTTEDGEITNREAWLNGSTAGQVGAWSVSIFDEVAFRVQDHVLLGMLGPVSP